MQLLNSNIPRRAQTTRYGNKKAQDTQYLVLFVCCSFFVQQRWWTSAELNRGLTAVRKAFYTFSLRLVSKKRFRRRTLFFMPSEVLRARQKVKTRRRYPTMNGVSFSVVGSGERNGA